MDRRVHIKIINPNTTNLFTEKMLAAVQRIAAPGSTLEAASPRTGTPSVESHFEEAIATVGVMEEVLAGEAAGVDAYVIACFGDTGVAQAREIARGPVIGMTEAAYFSACLVAATFSVVTLPPRTKIHAERVLRESGLQVRCPRVRAIDVPVLDLDKEDAAVAAALREEARRAITEDHAEAIVLGCAGLTDLVEPLTQELGVPVIDGVTVAVKWAEGLVSLGLKTSKISSFAFPPNKVLTGAWAALSQAGVGRSGGGT
jgi:allantoin racemase